MENLPDNPVTFLVESYGEIELHFPDSPINTKAEMALRFQRSFMDGENRRMTLNEFQLRCKQTAGRLRAVENEEDH